MLLAISAHRSTQRSFVSYCSRSRFRFQRQDNTFGMVLDAGAGAALTRTSPSTLHSAQDASSFQLRATVLAVQTETADEWLDDLAAAVAVASDEPWPQHLKWWAAFWDRSHVLVNASHAGSGAGRDSGDASALNDMYAITRYTQAVQSRGGSTIWPIKFNGMVSHPAFRVREFPHFRISCLLDLEDSCLETLLAHRPSHAQWTKATASPTSETGVPATGLTVRGLALFSCFRLLRRLRVLLMSLGGRTRAFPTVQC